MKVGLKAFGSSIASTLFTGKVFYGYSTILDALTVVADTSKLVTVTASNAIFP